MICKLPRACLEQTRSVLRARMSFCVKLHVFPSIKFEPQAWHCILCCQNSDKWSNIIIHTFKIEQEMNALGSILSYFTHSSDVAHRLAKGY